MGKNKLRIMTMALPIILLVMVFINPSDNRREAHDRLLSKSENTVYSKLKSDTASSRLFILFDSVQRLIRDEKRKLRGNGSTMFLLSTGLTEIEECDTCNSGEKVSDSLIKTKYFLHFKDFTLASNSSFFIQNGKYYIERFVVEKENENYQIAHKDTVQSKVRLAISLDETKQNISLLIPITKEEYSVLRIVYIVLLAILILIAFRVFIFMPFQLLMNIAQGDPFNKANIKYLKTIGWVTIGFTLLFLILPVLFKLLLPHLIPPEIYFPFWPTFFSYKWQFSIGVAALLLANAFESGYMLEEEQELTV